MSTFPYKRVVVIGVTSSGKSTLAATLAGRFHMDFIELDALHWEPGWQEAPLEVFRERVEKAVQAERWSVAGNYRVVRDLVWPRADALLWLDYPFITVFCSLPAALSSAGGPRKCCGARTWNHSLSTSSSGRRIRSST